MSPVDVSALAVVAVGLSVFALAVVLAVAMKLGALLRAYDGLVAGEDGASFTSAVGRQTAVAKGLAREVHALRDDVEQTRAALADALRHVAVVRYDAFGDLGGLLSFSAALLDDAGDGIVLTSINGRSETRTYAKGVLAGVSDQGLSPEEQEAVDKAVGQATPVRSS